MAIGAQVAPPHGYRQTPIRRAIWLLWRTYGKILPILSSYCIVTHNIRRASIYPCVHRHSKKRKLSPRREKAAAPTRGGKERKGKRKKFNLKGKNQAPYKNAAPTELDLVLVVTTFILVTPFHAHNTALNIQENLVPWPC
jgi:hypothetical protein